jgi:hypothetical protein
MLVLTPILRTSLMMAVWFKRVLICGAVMLLWHFNYLTPLEAISLVMGL